MAEAAAQLSAARSLAAAELLQAGPNGTGADFGVWGGPATEPSLVDTGSTGHYIGGLFGPGFFQLNANVSRVFLLKEDKLTFKLQGY